MSEIYDVAIIGGGHNGLLEIERVAPDLLKGDIAILGEPTNNAVEAGCQGVLRGRGKPARILVPDSRRVE